MKNRKSVIWLVTILVLALSLVLGCGSDDGTTPPVDDTTEATIGAAGGTLSRTGEATLVIPAGALPGDVDFTLDEDTTPVALVGTRAFATPVFTIGPDGTQFGAPALLTLVYDEGDLNGADESDIVIYTHDGSGWTPLATTVNEAANTASASIQHLSDYCATIPYGEAAEGVFAMLELTRVVNFLGVLNNTDMITARFDTVIDPCSVHYSLQPDSVFCDDYKLVWDDMTRFYLDDSAVPEFLVPGDTYTFEVHGNAAVPDLTESIVMPLVAPYVTNIDLQEVLSLDGFTVEWAGVDAGTVILGLIAEGLAETVEIETANDGAYAFTADDLSDLEPGVYALTLLKNDFATIDAPGYDPNSVIRAGSVNTTLVSLTDGGGIGPAGGSVALGGDGHLTIPAGALSSTVDFNAEINTTPTAAPDGWAFMTPVYTLTPSGTQFAIDASLVFEYDEDDLNGGDEETIAIFTDTGSGWTQLTSDVIDALDRVEAEIDHLSDFAALVEVPVVGDGVYCEIEVRRTMLYFFDSVMRGDDVQVRFDAIVDPEPDTPLDADGVTFNSWTLDWDTTDDRYEYSAEPDELLELGQPYSYVVDGDADVPDLMGDVTFIDAEPYLTSPASGASVPTTGFDIQWDNTSAGSVRLVVTNQNAVEIINTLTPNDGSYTVSAGDLAGSPDGILLVDLICETTGLIDAAGYDPASNWTCYSYSVLTLNLGGAAR